MRLRVALGMGALVLLVACGGSTPKAQPSGYVTDDQVKASDKTTSSTVGTGSSTTAGAKLSFCDAWKASRDLGSSETSGQPDFERMQRSIIALRDASPASLDPELDVLLTDLDRLRTIGQRYSWRFDDTTKVSADDAAAIKDITAAIARFGTSSKVARHAQDACT